MLAGQPIVPKHVWSNIDDPVKYTDPNPIGTGPFTEIVKFTNQVWELKVKILIIGKKENLKLINFAFLLFYQMNNNSCSY